MGNCVAPVLFVFDQIQDLRPSVLPRMGDDRYLAIEVGSPRGSSVCFRESRQRGTNRLNRERPSSGDADRKALADVEKV